LSKQKQNTGLTGYSKSVTFHTVKDFLKGMPTVLVFEPAETLVRHIKQ